MFDFLNKLDDELKDMAWKWPKKDKKTEDKSENKSVKKEEAKKTTQDTKTVSQNNPEVVITSVSNSKSTQWEWQKTTGKKWPKKVHNNIYPNWVKWWNWC